MSGAVLRLLLFLLPFLLFLLWLWIAKGTRFGRESLTRETERRITGAGLGLIALAIAGFVAFGIFSGGDAPEGRDYVPPRMMDGEIAPGEFKDKDGDSSDGTEDGGEADRGDG